MKVKKENLILGSSSSLFGLAAIFYYVTDAWWGYKWVWDTQDYIILPPIGILALIGGILTLKGKYALWAAIFISSPIVLLSIYLIIEAFVWNIGAIFQN